MEKRVHVLWIYVKRAPDLKDAWIGFCPELDVVSQGTSLRHAFEMTKEAVSLTLEDDLNRGVDDPLAERRMTSSELLAEFFEFLRSAKPVLLTKALNEPSDISAMAALVPFADGNGYGAGGDGEG